MRRPTTLSTTLYLLVMWYAPRWLRQSLPRAWRKRELSRLLEHVPPPEVGPQ